MTLETLPARTPLTGSNAVAWAEAILKGLSAPVTDLNVGYLLGWFHNEGGGGENNPMNTTLRTSGSAGSINSDGVQNYKTPQDGVDATVSTLAIYPAVVASLKTGRGIVGPNVGVELSKWSGGGYSSIHPIAVHLANKQTGPSGVCDFKGSVNLATGEWNIEGIPGKDNIDWGSDAKEYSAEIQIAIGPKGGKWRIKGEAANSRPLG
jgi:hypothetical protein